MVQTIIKSADLVRALEGGVDTLLEINLHLPGGGSFGDMTDTRPKIYLRRNGDVTVLPSPQFVADAFAASDKSRLEGLDFWPDSQAGEELVDLCSFEDELRKLLSPNPTRGLFFLYDIVGRHRIPVEVQFCPEGHQPFKEVPGLVVRYAHITAPPNYTRSLLAFCAEC